MKGSRRDTEVSYLSSTEKASHYLVCSVAGALLSNMRRASYSEYPTKLDSFHFSRIQCGFFIGRKMAFFIEHTE